MSLYGCLFRYRPRPARRPLEDFLSEALADLLNRLPTATVSGFVVDVLLAGTPAQAGWQDFIAARSNARLQWATQRAIPGGIIDLLLTVDGDPVVIVENKVGAAVRTHAPIVEDEDGETEVVEADPNQLRTYGHWLARSCASKPWPGALVLLTHFSRPPSDWDRSDYGVSNLSVCRWRRVWQWAQALSGRNGRTSTDGGLRESWVDLAAELARFLEEQEMSSDFATALDLAKAQIFLGSAARIDRTFALVAERLDRLRRSLGATTSKIYDAEYDSDGGAIWAWAFLKEPQRVRDSWYVAWGICFPSEDSEWWGGCEPPLPDVPFVFVAADTEERGPAIPVALIAPGELPDGWSVDAGEGELVIARPVHTLRQDPEGWATDLADWVALEADRIVPVVRRLAAKIG